MDPIAAKLMSAAGAAADPVYVDDVFSTFLHDGTSSAQTITNGIDLSGEGGLVWFKDRTSGWGHQHHLIDTERGATKVIYSDSSVPQATDSNSLTAFNSDGFSIGTSGPINYSGNIYCSWTFRKCPGFFDIVTYTGNGSNRTISHNLGSVPGSIWIKQTSGQNKWSVYHRGSYSTNPSHYELHLNETEGIADEGDVFNDTEPTSTVFTVGTNSGVNGSGQTYVAYIFAHDDQSFGEDGNEAIIKCGNYTGNGGTQSIDVGFEPQFLITKRTDSTGNWFIHDIMRKFAATGTNEAATLRANSNLAEYTNTARIHVNSTGFDFDAESSSDVNASNGSYIYIAIRRPHKPPSTGTDVFAIDTKSAKSANTPSYTTNFPVDFALRRNDITSVNSPTIFARLTAPERLLTNTTAAATTDATFDDHFMFNNGYGNFSSADSNDYGYFFKRAPGFFDVVTYTGTGSAQTVNHNLGVTPELMIVKDRDGGSYWAVYSSALGATKYLQLNGNNAEGTSVAVWNNTSPTSSVFTVNYAGAVNTSGNKYVAYLFASLDGISKIGTYTGAGGSTDVDVDCGFTNGARFVIIKKTNSIGDWNVFDTSRGINSGTEKYFTLNNSFAPYEFDVIDPLSSGFTVVNETAASQGFNVSGNTYLFIAIA